MKRRCKDTNFKDFPKYGGRGIKVCERWDGSFINFLADMGERPPGHSIDRLDSNGDYEPGNCRWATDLQQLTENKRDMRPVAIGGVLYPNRASACAAFGISPTTVQERLRLGHSIEEAITTPKGKLPRTRARESYLPKDKR